MCVAGRRGGQRHEDWGWGECVRQEGGEASDMRIGDGVSVCGRKEGRSVT